MSADLDKLDELAAAATGWACRACGFHPDTTPDWCAAGCGRDYNKITKAFNPEAVNGLLVVWPAISAELRAAREVVEAAQDVRDALSDERDNLADNQGWAWAILEAFSALNALADENGILLAATSTLEAYSEAGGETLAEVSTSGNEEPTNGS